MEWRLHPAQFIKLMRKTGWLSKQEVIGLLPSTFSTYSHMASILTDGQNRRRGKITQILPSNIYNAINLSLRKYGLTSVLRTSHFFAQISLESDHFETVTEYASGNSYDKSVDPAKATELGNDLPGDGPRFKGRGLIQTTGKSHYRKYGIYRGIDMITGTNNERFEIDALTACDSAGFYWVCEKTRDRTLGADGKMHWKLDGEQNISRRADKSALKYLTDDKKIQEDVSSVTRQINRAELAINERINLFKHAYSELSDLTANRTENIKK